MAVDLKLLSAHSINVCHQIATYEKSTEIILHSVWARFLLFFLFLFFASIRYRFFFREYCQRRIVGGVCYSLLFESTPYCELWSYNVASKLIASHLIEHSTVVSSRHVCGFDTISIFICNILYSINLWSIYWLSAFKTQKYYYTFNQQWQKWQWSI